MNTAVYILLTLVDRRNGDAVRLLRDRPGVVRLDVLEGQPNLIVLFEAADRMELAECVSQALATLDNDISDLRLLVGRNDS